MTPHLYQLCVFFAIGTLVGIAAQMTRFCTMGAISDWVNGGDRGRLYSWVLAMAVAMFGVGLMDALGVRIGNDSFPPYRSASLAWVRHLIGGAMFGVGMTLASGCAQRNLVRLGGGNLKSLVVLAVAALFSWLMMWSRFYEFVFDNWLAPLNLDLARWGASGQALGQLAGGSNGTGRSDAWIGTVLGVALVLVMLSRRELRQRPENLLGGLIIGAAVVMAWLATAGSQGISWRDWAELESTPPARLAAQSLTFVSPLGDAVRWLLNTSNTAYVTIGMTSCAGVLVGALARSLRDRQFSIEWFADKREAVLHLIGAALMGMGGVLAMGCTVGQGITGVSTLALGSFISLAAMVAAAALTMRTRFGLGARRCASPYVNTEY